MESGQSSLMVSIGCLEPELGSKSGAQAQSQGHSLGAGTRSKAEKQRSGIRTTGTRNMQSSGVRQVQGPQKQPAKDFSSCLDNFLFLFLVEVKFPRQLVGLDISPNQ